MTTDHNSNSAFLFPSVNGTYTLFRLSPPAKLLEFYSGAANRGYLADPAEVAREKVTLAQKYGYSLAPDQLEGGAAETKDPRQIFYGLEPGWIVSLADKCIYKPEDEQMQKVYKS